MKILVSKQFASTQGEIITEMQLTFKERLRILRRGYIMVGQLTFNKQTQPMRIELDRDEILRKAVEREKQNPIPQNGHETLNSMKNVPVETLEKSLKQLRRQALFLEDEIKRRGEKKIKIVK